MDFWTCGFFPGSIYSLLERTIKYPQSIETKSSTDISHVRTMLKKLGLRWSNPLHEQAKRTDTHDVGFMIMPHMQPRWELFHDVRALEAITTAAESLYSRFDPRTKAIRSWDDLDWLTDVGHKTKENDFLVIIDSMCNMELLFYSAAQCGDSRFYDAAVQHSKTLLKSHLRVEASATRPGYHDSLYSTAHLVNFCPETGVIKGTHTAQGYSKDSTWARGQAWGILGYAQAYQASREPDFLDAACGLAEYFMLRLENAPDCVEMPAKSSSGGTCGRYVPLWDFDALICNEEFPLRDSSAGAIAANGMLILSQLLMGQGDRVLAARYLDAALLIVQDVLDLSLAKETASINTVVDKDGTSLEIVDDCANQRFDSILKNATVCNNPASTTKSRSWDSGLVYGDYYLVEFGTRLLRFGLV